MGDRLSAASHDAVTQLNDLWNADNLFGVITLVGQQYQKEENIGNYCLRVPVIDREMERERNKHKTKRHTLQTVQRLLVCKKIQSGVSIPGNYLSTPH